MMRKFVDCDAIAYRVGEAESLPIPDVAVDYAFANMYLHHVESPPEAIREMARILKPGGKLVITDLDEHRFEFLRTEHHDRYYGGHTIIRNSQRRSIAFDLLEYIHKSVSCF